MDPLEVRFFQRHRAVRPRELVQVFLLQVPVRGGLGRSTDRENDVVRLPDDRSPVRDSKASLAAASDENLDGHTNVVEHEDQLSNSKDSLRLELPGAGAVVLRVLSVEVVRRLR